MSRAAKPKQMLALTQSSTMLQLTAGRVQDEDLYTSPVVVTAADHATAVEAQLSAMGISPARLILEPCARNTAPAVALAALTADPEDLLLVMPSDHVVLDDKAFSAAVRIAMLQAERGWLITFGISPHKPETGYGYIRRGNELGPGVFKAARFIEKPPLALAAQYFAEGCYDWNGGIFLFRADAFISALQAYAPNILASAKLAIEGSRNEGYRVLPEGGVFRKCPSESIDNAVMEKSDLIAVVPVDMSWSDVGSWDALYDIQRKDSSQNVTSGDVIALDTEGCLIHSDGPVVVTIGLSELVVISTGDATLIMPRGHSQRVKEAVSALAAAAHPTL